MSKIRKLALFDVHWFDFVKSNVNATPFHHPAWAGLLSECYKFPAFGLGFENRIGQLVFGMPTLEIKRPWGAPRWISLPFTDYCAPLVRDVTAQQELSQSLAITKQNYGLSSIEIRANLHTSRPEGRKVFSQSDGFLHILKLESDAQQVFRRFKKTQVQQRILKAEREGIKIRRGNSLYDLNFFYKLHTMTRQRLGTPVQPKRFFKLLAERVLNADLGFLLIAYKDKRPIAGAVFLAWNGVIIYKYSASDLAFLHHRPNNLLLWHAIRWGCESGYHTFNFGRTDADHIGLRTFKGGWGTEELPLVYSVVRDRPPRVSSNRLKKAMSRAIRRLPFWFCRITGELFYKYSV
jgi:CelD/BcsL family acetyltransferase involved in cellulose biosynthesis